MLYRDVEPSLRVMPLFQERLKKEFNSQYMPWMCTKIRIWRQACIMTASAQNCLSKFLLLSSNHISQSCGRSNKWNNWLTSSIICDPLMWKWVGAKSRKSFNGLNPQLLRSAKMHHPWPNNRSLKLQSITRNASLLCNSSSYSSPQCTSGSISHRVNISNILSI